MAREWGADAGVAESFLANSRYRKDWALKLLNDELSGTNGQKTVVALWGLAYKADTDSTKNSPAISLLQSLGPFSARVYDPKAVLDKKMFPKVTQVPSALEACRGAHVLAVMTPWKEFSSVPPARVREELAGNAILDPWGILDEDRYASLGFHARRIGAKKRESAP